MYSARTAGEQQIRDATMIAGVAAREAVSADKPTHTKNPPASWRTDFLYGREYDTLESFFDSNIYEESI